jgi:hypothetical protein
MGAEGFARCTEWLDRSCSIANGDARKRALSPQLLCADLPQGTIIKAKYVDDQYGPRMAFELPRRSFRSVEPAAFSCMRFLALPGRGCRWWFDYSTLKNLPPEKIRWYLRFSKQDGAGLWGGRILADAQPGEVVRQLRTQPTESHLGHYDLRLSNCRIVRRDDMVEEGKSMRQTYKGRELAIEIALKNFGAGVPNLPLTIEGYEAILRQSFKLLDKLHGGDVVRRT